MTWITIKDVTAGSELFNGSPIYAYVTGIKISGGNNVATRPVQGVETEITARDGNDANSVGSNFNNRMGFNSYNSFNNPTITLNGGWTEEAGSINNAGSVLTPYKLFRMANSDHQFIINGGLSMPNIVAGENGSGYYTDEDGIPAVFITPFSLDENYPNGTNFVAWAATLRVDRLE